MGARYAYLTCSNNRNPVVQFWRNIVYTFVCETPVTTNTMLDRVSSSSLSWNGPKLSWTHIQKMRLGYWKNTGDWLRACRMMTKGNFAKTFFLGLLKWTNKKHFICVLDPFGGLKHLTAARLFYSFFSRRDKPLYENCRRIKFTVFATKIFWCVVGRAVRWSNIPTRSPESVDFSWGQRLCETNPIQLNTGTTPIFCPEPFPIQLFACPFGSQLVIRCKVGSSGDGDQLVAKFCMRGEESLVFAFLSFNYLNGWGMRLHICLGIQFSWKNVWGDSFGVHRFTLNRVNFLRDLTRTKAFKVNWGRQFSVGH